jgi:acetaldehyde dehydrogenase (acetylating)
MATVGVIARHPERRLIEIAEPFGVVAAIVPSTNPTSTAIYKLLIAIKARCAIVVSAHPSAARCIMATTSLLNDAARSAGLPEGAIGWMTTVTLAGTQALMAAREVSVILATGGLGLVRAAYSAGKPAYGVGPGNAPCYVESSADIVKAADDILAGKTFDHGVLCSSPNAVVVDRAVAPALRAAMLQGGAHFLSGADADRLARVLVGPERLPNPALVGRSAAHIARHAGVSVPEQTRALVVELAGVGREYPLSIEKLCPVLAYYEVADWREGCERCTQILRYGGLGHTMSIHSQNDAVILEFGLRKPAFRICVNTATTHGSIGLTTGLDPAMTLGCGGFGGNITSDNITPRHLLNVKRVAYELRPRGQRAVPAAAPAATSVAPAEAPAALPRVPAAPAVPPIPAERLALGIDRFLGERGAPATPRPAEPPTPRSPESFVCEDDVRRAAAAGQRLLIGPRTIVTPAARDAGDAWSVFVWLDGTPR